jgi:deoxyhypusine synthase
LAVGIGYKRVIQIIFHKEAVVWIENVIAEFGEEFFEQTSSVNSILLLAKFINKLYLKPVLETILLPCQLIVGIFKQPASMDRQVN